MIALKFLPSLADLFPNCFQQWIYQTNLLFDAHISDDLLERFREELVIRIIYEFMFF